MPAENPVDNIDQYIVPIDADGLQFGTGILIAPNWILTCEHVVKLNEGEGLVAKKIKIKWQNIFVEARLVYSTSYSQSDIALLYAPLENDRYIRFGSDPKASMTKGHEFFFGGFPNDQLDTGTLTYEGPKKRNNILFLKFKDSYVKNGTSGGPVLQKPRGEFCAMMMENRSQDYDAGGLCTPVSIIIEELKKVDEFDFGLIKFAQENPVNESINNMEGDWYLECNREVPLSIFQEKSAVKTSRPHFFFVPGMISDAHESLVKRFMREKSHSDRHSVKWIQISPEAVSNLHNIQKEVLGETLRHCGISNEIINNEPVEDAGMIYQRSNIFQNGSITFISLKFYLNDYSWNSNNTDLLLRFIEDYVSFWSVDIPRNKKDVEIYILFKLIRDDNCENLKKESSMIKRFFSMIKKSKKEKGEMEFLRSIKKYYNGANGPLTFEPLSLVGYEKVKRLLDKNDDKFVNRQYSALLEEFPSTEEWRMKEIENKIIEWFNKNQNI